MKLERITPDDWERLRTLRLRALQDSPDAFARTLDEEEDQPESFWRGRLATPSVVTLVAVDEGADVGLVTGLPWDGEPDAFGLVGMWVAPEARGRGAGDLLIVGLVVEARERGFRRLLLEVGDHNAPAIRLYERHHFHPTGLTGTLPPPRESITEHQRARDLHPPATP